MNKALFLRQSSRPIPRVARMMRAASEMGYEAIFLGAMREANLSRIDEWEGLQVERIGVVFPLLNGTRPLTYAVGTIRYSIAAFRRLRQLRPSITHASDIECGVAALLYRLTAQTRFIYNIHDNLSQRYSVPRPVRWLLNFLEGVVVLGSDITLVPEAFRRDALPSWCRARVRVVRNSPEDPGYVVRDRHGSDSIRLFFGGWLDRGRGLQGLVDMVAANDDLELIVAGEGSAETVRWLSAQVRVRYLGFCSHKEVIEETKRCDIVVALYDPRRLINVFAASNKIAEALAVGRPTLVNTEARIAGYLSSHGCCITVPYHAVVDAAPLLRDFILDRGAYQHACEAARKCYDRDYHYDAVRQDMISVLDASRGATG